MPVAPRERWAGAIMAVAGLLGLGLALVAVAAQAAPSDVQTAALADLSIEQLRDVEVTTVSRFAEPLDRAAAAAYIISADDIRRSGATTIAEVLRLAPNLNVARADANQYAISARGFNNVLANKMLVLIDGRTAYSPLFSGVFWEAQDVDLQDIDRIEVISGPSTALWGSNAVNGLIHIITRPAADTQGLAAQATVGRRQRGATLRYGAPAASGGHFRLYAKQYDRDDTQRADGSSVHDQANGYQLGFRADWGQLDDRLTLQGDAYQGRIDQPTSARHFSGLSLLTRWERNFGQGADASVQASLERTTRDHPQTLAETLDTVDIVAQYGFRPAAEHRVLVGLGYRRADDELTQFPPLAFIPGSRSLNWGRIFAQDHLQLSPALALTAATSFERNPYTGTEMLPSLRLAWQIDAQRMAWAALSRAVRAPSRVDREFVQPAEPPFVIAGGPNFRSEVSNVAEIGYRAQRGSAWSYALTLFHHELRRLRSLAPMPDGLQFENGYRGWTRGIETWMRWRVMEPWRIDAGATLLQQHLRLSPGSLDAAGTQALGNDPRASWTLRSSLDLSSQHAWELAVRHVGALAKPAVPAYTAVDMRLAWRVTPNTELAVGVQNLFDPQHAEWGPAGNRVEFLRTWSLQWRWHP